MSKKQTVYQRLGLEIMCDMDGVLVDFDKQAAAIGFPPEVLAEPKKKGHFWATVGANSKKGIPFWGLMDSLPDYQQLWDHISPSKPTILTATGHVGNAMVEKAQWIMDRFGMTPTIFVRKSSDKAFYATPNRILIDDREKCIGPWREAGGIGILHTSAQDTIEQLNDFVAQRIELAARLDAEAGMLLASNSKLFKEMGA